MINRRKKRKTVVYRQNYKKQWYLKHKEEILKKNKERKLRLKLEWKNFKKTLSCVVCGEDDPSTFDFHHLKKDKSNRSISTLVKNFNFTEAYEEVKKCVVLCSNCHRKLHYQKGKKKAHKKGIKVSLKG